MTMIGKNIKELATPELVIDLNIVDQNYKNQLKLSLLF